MKTYVSLKLLTILHGYLTKNKSNLYAERWTAYN